jgi:hypothetical protein
MSVEAWIAGNEGTQDIAGWSKCFGSVFGPLRGSAHEPFDG